MAFRAFPSFCAEAAYERYLPLRGFSPAKSFCSNLAVHQGRIEVAAQLDFRDSASIAHKPHSQRDIQCPAGNTLCSLLSELQAADKAIGRNVCRCIGVYVLVPGNTISETLTTKTKARSPTRPTTERTTELVTRPSSRDTDSLTADSLPRITSSTECAKATSIASKTTKTSEWRTAAPSSASTSPKSSTISGASSASPTTFNSASSSISKITPSSNTSTESSSSSTMLPVSSSSPLNIFPSSASSGYSTTSATSASPFSSSSSSIGSSDPSSLCSPTCAYPTATTACPTVTATGLAYKRYYAGQCYIENTANPGTGGELAVYTRFRGAYDMCAATQYCANAAGAAYGPYHSFDLHYTCSNSSWMCVQYYNGNSDATYFDVLDLDVAVAFGYSY